MRVSESYKTVWWLRLVGSLKLYVSSAKEPYKRDDILQMSHTLIDNHAQSLYESRQRDSLVQETIRWLRLVGSLKL